MGNKGGVMGASSRSYCYFNKENRDRHVNCHQPKNKFERALNDKPKQSIQGYRVKILQSGFMTKAREENGKTILTLRHVAKRP